MPSAVDFLPSSITTLVNLATMRSRYLGSGVILRFGTSRLRGMTIYLVLLSVAGSPAATRPPAQSLREPASGRLTSFSLLGALDAVLGATLRAARLVGVRGAS